MNLENLNDLEEIMYALEHTDGAFSAIVINNEKVKLFLEKYDIAETGNSGASSRGKNYEFVNEILTDILYELAEYGR
jgi:hypothetical protein